MIYNPIIKKLRDKEVVNFFDSKNKLFIKFQINKKETKFIYWQRFVSKDRRNWTEWNRYLSLKETAFCINSLKNLSNA